MNVSNQIRKALAAGALNMQQLADANGWDKETRWSASTNLGQMKKRGEIAMHMEDGKAVYELVAGYVPKRSGDQPKTEPKRAATKAKGKRGDKAKKPVATVKQQRARRPAETAGLQELVAGVAGGTLFGNAARPRSDFDLAKRIDAIAVDIEEALADAVDADHGKDLLKHLIVAHGALNRAARAYARR